MTDKCSFYKDKMLDYLDGELAEEAEKQFRQHLDACPDCRRELMQWEGMFNLLELPEENPGQGFTESVLQTIKNQEHNKAADLQTEKSSWSLRNLTLSLTGIFLLAFSISIWLLIGAGQPLFHTAAQSIRIIMEAALGLLPAPLILGLYQVGSSPGTFLAAVLTGLQQKLLFMCSLSETLFVIIRALPPTTWAVILAAGFISSLLLGRMLGNDIEIKNQNS
ncbi:MAG: zf-HC2 domain-containing protein [Syntrophaceticus sp.]|nr:zf-HC2 domain-containing protein [Syntrophaceticus sp.]